MTSKKNLSLALIFLGSLFRMAGLAASSAWYDELYTLYLSRLPVTQIIHFQSLEFNPPLWEILLHPLTNLWPSVLAARLPALACSLAGLSIAWHIMNVLHFSDDQRLLAVGWIAFLPGLLWVAQDGRVYALLSLLYLLGIAAALQDRGIHLATIGLLMIYAHNTAPAFLASLLILLWFLSRRNTSTLRASLRALGIGSIWLVFWLPWALPSLRTWGSQGYLPRLTAFYFIHQLILAWLGPGTPALFLLTAFLLSASIWLGDDKSLLPLTFALPVVLLLLVSLAWTNVTTYRVLSVLGIPFGLWLGRALVWRRPSRTWILPALWGSAILSALLMWNPALRGGNLSEAAAMIRRHWRAGDRIVYATGTVALPFDYALPDLPRGCILDEQLHPALLQPAIQTAFGFERCRLTQTDERLWFILPDDPLIRPEILARLRAIAERGHLEARVTYSQTPSVNIYLIEKQRP